MRKTGTIAILLASVGLLTSCLPAGDAVDDGMSPEDAKRYTQAVEREIVDAMPNQFVRTVLQKETGTFLPCSRDGAEQWAGGLTAQIQPGVDPDAVLDPIEEHFANVDELTVSRREDSGNVLVEVVGPHRSAWVVRYDAKRAEAYLTSFSPCIRLPSDIWRGDKF
ncbi:hypothetical protein [Microbacterium testaceum]|uniref:hypothetical protein n=1 Tax=Microbacterium testaceum TaxID=2033 RepID=UPI00128F1BDC|nr:hypothetical protein [Microbacterium testaceum]